MPWLLLVIGKTSPKEIYSFIFRFTRNYYFFFFVGSGGGAEVDAQGDLEAASQSAGEVMHFTCQVHV
jgi:hypothetical protein